MSRRGAAMRGVSYPVGERELLMRLHEQGVSLSAISRQTGEECLLIPDPGYSERRMRDVEQFVWHYNHQRPHLSLRGLTPVCLGTIQSATTNSSPLADELDCGQFVHGGHGFRNRESTLCDVLAGLKSRRKQTDGLASVRRDEDSRGQQAFTNPSLACFGLAVDSKKRNADPTVAFFQIRECGQDFTRADSHDVILRADKIDSGFSRGRELEPGVDALHGALFSPLPF